MSLCGQEKAICSNEKQGRPQEDIEKYPNMATLIYDLSFDDLMSSWSHLLVSGLIQ